MKKLVVISTSSVPAVGGSTILISNLLTEYPGEVHVISLFDKLGHEDLQLIPSYPVHRFTTPWSFVNEFAYRYYTYMRPLIIRFMVKKLNEIKADAVLAVYPTGFILDCAYEASKITGIRFWVHMHDLWEENTRENTLEYKLAKKKEQQILTQAEKVFCMTDVQAAYYHTKYNINPFILPHTIPSIKLKSHFKVNEDSKQIYNILYSGSVSWHMNEDALRTFVAAINMLPDNYKVTMLVKNNTDYLKQIGIYSPNITYKWVGTDEAFSIQKDADVLFLPLSFKNCSVNEVNTVFATKALDYLSSGTPILVFSPSSSFHNQSASRNSWAHIVDKDDPTVLSKEIINLCKNHDLQKKLLVGAKLEAQERSAKFHAEFLFNQL
jgi:hypothetical protein